MNKLLLASTNNPAAIQEQGSRARRFESICNFIENEVISSVVSIKKC